MIQHPLWCNEDQWMSGVSSKTLIRDQIRNALRIGSNRVARGCTVTLEPSINWLPLVDWQERYIHAPVGFDEIASGKISKLGIDELSSAQARQRYLLRLRTEVCLLSLCYSSSKVSRLSIAGQIRK